MSIDRPSIRARGTTEFQGGPLDGLILVTAHLERLVAAIEIVRLPDGGHMMRQLLADGEGGEVAGHYRLSPKSEGGSGDYYWQAPEHR